MKGLGLPCEVQKVLEAHCWECHGPVPQNDAPFSLANRELLLAKAPDGGTFLALALKRIKDMKFRMPPVPNDPVPAADVHVLEVWSAAGAPDQKCTTCAEDPFSCGDACTSGVTWVEMPGTGQDYKEMSPGRACVGCHAVAAPPNLALWLGGTVYPSGHEPDYCVGTNAGDAVVKIKDANGATHDLPVNAAGNFYLLKSDAPAFKAPYTATLSAGGKERQMVGDQTSGDCNGCHTEDGANIDPDKTKKAPGRIVVP